jgi:hypothetical protein
VSADHLVPYRWQPGQSGNPGGRPKGRSLTSIFRELLDLEIDPRSGLTLADGKRVADVVAERFMLGLLTGSLTGPQVRFMRELLDRLEGRTPATSPIKPDKFDLSQVVAEAEAAAEEHRSAEPPTKQEGKP